MVRGGWGSSLPAPLPDRDTRPAPAASCLGPRPYARVGTCRRRKPLMEPLTACLSGERHRAALGALNADP